MSVLPLFGTVVLALALTGCYTQLGTVASSEDTTPSTTTVADASPSSDAVAHTSSETDTLDAVDDFFQDFDHYALKYLDPSDRALVKRATRLLEARANSEISRATYRDRLNDFRLDHPGFYGNFFGDPFYATYDLRFTRLAELRQRINTFVNPQNSIRNTAGFYCSPFSYDPNFGGVCRGFQYASSDFFFLPSSSFDPAFSHALSPRSGVSFAGAYQVSSLMGHRAGEEHSVRASEHSSTKTSTQDQSRSDASDPVLAGLPSGEREASFDVPSKVEPLSKEEIASLTKSLREGLSPQERITLLQHLRASRSGVSSPRRHSVHDDLSLRVETIRRAARGQLYGSRSGRRGSTVERFDSPLSDVSSSELLDRLERRRGRHSVPRGYSTADRSTYSSDRTRRTVGRSTTGARDGSSTGSSSSGRSNTVDQSDSDQGSSSSSGRTGRGSDR